MQTKEKNFENDIEAYLLNSGGYEKGNQHTYDKTKAIDMPVLLSFIEKTQPKTWQRYKNVYGEKAEKQLYNIFQQNVSDYGLIHVLRNGIKDRGIEIRFAYFVPASNLNEELVEKYHQNILTETRQFAYSTQNNNTIDIVLSLNGIPVAALELKNQLTGQSVENAKRQFRQDRDPKEFIFHFNNRILVYFAVDLYEVAMTTELKGEDTYFLPFNQGSNGAGNVGDGGNPENPDGYATSYLWEKILNRDTFLSIIQRYISKEETTKVSLKNGKQVKKKTTQLIFPRYHQFDVVEKLVADTKSQKDGRNYLIQHSAGSGKSNSIAWLTYRLASLHDYEDKEVFQSVFVITDRRVLNRQLQNTILGFDHYEGQIATITDKDNSTVLRDAINDKKRIIITTLHRFPLIYKELDNHKGKKFAIIVDEAHSSQSGKSAEKLKAALADTDEALKEMAELEGKTEESIKDEMDVMVETLLTQGQHKNQFFYAFTATPKPKTLQTFGDVCGKDKEGHLKYTAFHHYSMRQAIDEGFILDVLQFFTPIETSYEIVKNIPENPEYEEPPAAKAIRDYHDNHQYVIENTIEVIVEQFREITLHKINGKAKAMVVSPSRAHAVRYYLTMKDYCKKKGYTDIHPLVAFSGEVNYEGKAYTETQMNSTSDMKISESALPLYFSSDMFNVLIVAEKYQTGFDEPLLHTMFVLKGLRGVKAVQTLSRLNRCHPDKNDTYVFDFCNSADSIQASFQPFYEDTMLGEPVDVNMVYKYLNDLKSFHLWSESAENAVFDVYKSEQNNVSIGKLTSLLKPVLDDFNQLEEDDRFKFRSLIRSFIRFYAYMAQIARTFDKELFKTYIFCEFLFKLLPKTPHEKVDLEGKLKLTHHLFKVQPSGAIILNPSVEDKTLKGEKGGTGKGKDIKRDLLENIIEKINLMYAGNFSEADRVIVESIYDKMQSEKKKLSKQAKNSDVNMFAKNIFPKYFEKIAMKCYEDQMDSFQKLFEDKQFFDRVMEEMGKAIYFNFKNGNVSE
ncbi:MAG: type I restriction endonuclease subunit R [Bacteroidales bacterium]|nr:type I restriction endonuclease subunit R [Bacteroidales bacterium]